MYMCVLKHGCYIFESLDQKPVCFHTLGTFDDRILCIVARHLQYIVMIVKWRLQIYNKTNIRELFLVSSPFSLGLFLDIRINYFMKGIEVILEFTQSSYNIKSYSYIYLCSWYKMCPTVKRQLLTKLQFLLQIKI